MAQSILNVPVDVNGTTKCNEDKGTWWWTDPVESAHDNANSGEWAINEWRIEGSTRDTAPNAEWIAIGFVNGDCWTEINVSIDWNLTLSGTGTAKLELFDHNGGLVSTPWSKAATSFGFDDLIDVDISTIGPCGGYLLMTLDAGDNSDLMYLTINSFT